MRLDLSDAQRAFQQAVEQIADASVRPAAADIESHGTIAPSLIAELARAGLLAPTVAAPGRERHDDVSLLLGIEALAGRSAAVALAVAAQAIAADAAAGAGGDAAAWATALADGSRTAAIALEGEAGVTVEGSTVRGTAPLVAGPAGADLFLLMGTSAQGTVAVLVTAGAGVTGQPAGTLAGFRGLEISTLTLDRATGRVLDARAGVTERLRLAVAFAALGIGDAAMREALATVKGRAGASEQSVQSVLADAATELAAARLLAWKAAGLLSAGAPAATEVAMAKLAAARAAQGAADRALEIAGVEAFRRGATVERLIRDARATEMLLGATDAQRTAVAVGILPQV